MTLMNPSAGDMIRVSGSIPGGLNVLETGGYQIDITGNASPATYQALLRSVTYVNPSDSPSSATRLVRFQAKDATTLVTASSNKSVSVTSVNDAPIAVANSFTISEDTLLTSEVRSNDTDADDATSTLVVDQVNGAGGNVGATLTTAKGATVVIDASGNLSYDPRTAFNSLQVGDPDGTDSVTYRVKDPQGATSNTVTVSFTITPVNDAPQAVARTYNAVTNVPLELAPVGNSGISGVKLRLNGNLLQGLTDPDDPAASATLVDETVPTTGGGSVNIDPDGTFVYTSQAGETASSDTFTFHPQDSHGAQSSQTVSLDLRARVFFVDGDQLAFGSGTPADPYVTVNAAATAAGTGDTIYIDNSLPPAGGNATLKSGQQVIGAGAPLTVDLGSTGTPSGVVTLKAAGSRPTVATGSGAAFTVAANSSIAGLSVDPFGTAQAINCPSVTGVTVTNVDVTDTGAASSGTRSMA